MLEIVILGRGGQGAQTAGNLLARALFEEGWHVQTFATYGGARRGTPVSSSLRADRRPIRLRSDITRAGAMLCFDDSLLTGPFLSRLADDALIVVNSARPAQALPRPGGQRVVPVDGRAIARANGLGRVVNSALLGAFVAVLGRPSLETVTAVIETAAPARIAENVAACRAAHALLAPAAEKTEEA